jgi:IclR family acetate operon transcriptional repressor
MGGWRGAERPEPPINGGLRQFTRLTKQLRIIYTLLQHGSSVHMVKGTTVQSVKRALEVLEIIADEPIAPSATQVAGRMRLHLSTTHHLLTTLVQAGYVLREDRKYSISTKVARLQAAVNRDLTVESSHWEALRKLVAATQESGYVSKWHHGDVVLAAVLEGSQSVRVGGLHVGIRGCAYARASGKVLLAFGPESRLDDYLARTTLEPCTENTIVDRDAFRSEIEVVRQTGYAVDREEFLRGVCCVAVPLPRHGGAAEFALCATLPASRFETSLRSIIDHLK